MQCLFSLAADGDEVAVGATLSSGAADTLHCVSPPLDIGQAEGRAAASSSGTGSQSVQVRLRVTNNGAVPADTSHTWLNFTLTN